ncbi:MAG: hypothetical protein K0R31_210 [Clostridiales bacterium]|nr:hypothetical protein [Clostridiales bacterium]
MTAFLYILPLTVALLLLLIYISEQKGKYKLYALRLVKGKDMEWLIQRVIPQKSNIYKFYRTNILRYSKCSVERLFTIKLGIFVSIIILAFMVKYTNISMQTKEIFQRFDYHTDLLFSNSEAIDKNLALKQEISALNLALKNIKKDDLLKNPEEVQLAIRSLITVPESELQLQMDTLVNKTYNRLKDYYEARRVNLLLYLITGVLISFVPEGYFAIRNVFIKADARKELRFLKKLIIMNGSIKPVDFREVLRVLIDKSVYFKQILQEIEDRNKRNFIDPKAIYGSLIKDSKDLEVKLFFEKLDEANNYDFDQAIKNIQNEFRLEKREANRRIRKRIEFIHTMGILGFMMLILILVLYLIEPWLKLYSMNNIGF